MSKKYYGFVFKEKYPMYEIQKIMKEFQAVAVKYVEAEILQLAIRDFIYYYNCIEFKEKFGNEVISTFCGAYDENNPRIQRVLEYISCDNYKDAMRLILLVIHLKIREQCKYTDADFERDDEYIFNNHFYLFPHSDGKTYVMFFGNEAVKKAILSKNYLEDYSFQDSTDRPKDIPKAEYKERERIWDDLLYPTYRPRIEGLSFELTANETLPRVSFTKESFEKLERLEKLEKMPKPSEKEIIGMLTDSFVDYPSKKCDDPDFDWVEYIKTDEYKKWRKHNIEKTKSNLKMFDLDEIKQLISTNI